MNSHRNAQFTMLVCLLLLLVPISFTLAQTTTENNTRVQVGRDIVIPADTLTKGDVVAVLGDVDVLGEVTGDVVAVGGSIDIDGLVKGDVVSVGGTVRLGDDAVVEGQVTAIGGGVNQEPSSSVLGGIHSINIGNLSIRPRLRPNLSLLRWRSPQAAFGYSLYVLGLYALSLLVLALTPSQVANVANAIDTQWRRALLLGLVTLLLIGPVTLAVVITVIGIPLVPIIWLAFVVAKILGYVAFVSYLGRRVGGSDRALHHLAELAIGVVVLALVRYVPVLGPVTSFFVNAITVGAVLDTRFGTNRPWMPPRQTR
ncbi:MAG: hypothetical protein ACOYEP_03740 [Limnochordia bacterium]|jgi:hypothetical protein